MNSIQSRFWSELGDSYRAFSALSDEGDWQLVIQQIATIVASNAGSTVKIFDYGSGLGTTAASIRRRLYGDHGLLSSWILYDPDDFARKVSAFNMPQISDQLNVAIIDEIPKNDKFDIVLFVHTSYYMDEFDTVLDRIFRTLFSEINSQVICVVMPKDSPFFIKGLNNMHVWTAEQIVTVARRKGFKCDVIKLRSRFRWLPEIRKDHILSHLVTSFVCGRSSVTDREVEIVRDALAGEVDFGDYLISIKR